MAGIVHQPVPSMASPQMINLTSLIDDAKCYELIRHCRWPEGVRCTACSSTAVIRHGHDETQRHRQRYRCKDCGARFDDLTGTILAGHHQPLRVWVLCLYFMGLNLSNQQIARELGLNDDDVHDMASHLREGLVAKVPEAVPSGFAPACHRAEDWGRAAPLMRGDEECRARIAVRPRRRSVRTGQHMAIGASGAKAAGEASMSGPARC
jgi:transposase-like protein